MFLACGVGAYVAGMFHVMTHAFFKACLFLGSGSVIHAMGGEQDMRKMGGLKSKLPGHVLDVPRRDARDRRHPAAGRLLLEGRDPGARRLRGAAGSDPLRRRPRHGRADGLLHVPPRLDDVLRRVPRHAEQEHHLHESPAHDDGSARRPGGPLGRRRLGRACRPSSARAPTGSARSCSRSSCRSQASRRAARGALRTAPSGSSSALGRRRRRPASSWRSSGTPRTAAARRRASPRRCPALYALVADKFRVDELYDARSSCGPSSGSPAFSGRSWTSSSSTGS